ncbi:MAG: glycosyltransferase family 2 protein [Chitinophagaceae bacterium]|nr:MAG: glycosyltransferase family 2 protein [Chitinophagaceae bacterium]
MQARLTVVIPTYNRCALLKRALSSVLSHWHAGGPVRIDVWDNHSSDGTEAFMEEISAGHPHVLYTRRLENIGPLRNYMDAISRVETEFYVALADDDYLIDGFPGEAMGILDADQSLGAVAMQTLHVDPAGGVTKINPDDRWKNGRCTPVETMHHWCRLGHFEWSSVVFRKSAYDAVGGLDLSYGLAADVSYQFDVFLKYPVFIVKKPAAVFSLHAGQQSSNLGMRYLKSAVQLVGRFKKAADDKPEFRAAFKALSRRYADEFSKLGFVTDSLSDLRSLIYEIAWSLGMPHYAVICLLRAMAGKARRRKLLPWRRGKARESKLGLISDYVPGAS